MILHNVEASATGLYECEAKIPLFMGTILRALARIQLQVYGKLVSGCGFLIWNEHVLVMYLGQI